MPWSRVLSFTDPLACQAAVQAGDVEILPTARGRFHVEMTQIGMDKLWMQRFGVVLPQISTIATAHDRMAIGFVETSSPNLQHCGVEVTPNDILVHGHDILHQRSASGFHYGTMSVPLNDFPAFAKRSLGESFWKNRAPRLSVRVLR
ncbi:hypothetical protein [Bradyrhizobium sp. STM 3562]|uniref:hypothetical protein n=1 Tax=Bradyrhizobium sp. STM 3562 TaxID=578924 RepID=UPI003890DA5C